LEYLKLYLSIEEFRFPDRLRAEILADASVLDAAVPQMGLQPIVENAIRHGLGQSLAAGKIQITATRAGDQLQIEIRDDGPGFSDDNLTQGRGIGLSNTRTRLAQLYGDNAKLFTGNGAHGGAVVTVTLPYHLAPDTAESEAIETHALQNADRR
jgi:LytS/YehU family sensor histidine kinase